MEYSDFKYLYSINFKSKYFIVLYNIKYNLYILEISNEGKVMYPKYEDYVEYYSFQHKSIFNNAYNVAINNLPNEIARKVEILREKYKNGIRITPKVIKNGGAILLAVALTFLAGCGKTNNTVENDVTEEVIIEEFDEKDDYPLIESKEYGEIKIEYVHEMYSETMGKNIIYCDDINEFRDYAKIDKIPTYNDIIKIFQEKEGVSAELREKIISELYVMEKEFPNLDLSILYYNANRMKIVECDSDELETKGINSIAIFKADTGEAYFDKDAEISDFTIAHEILGHGSTEAVFEDNDKIIYSGFIEKILENVDGVYYSKEIGKMFAEGVADIIAEKTSNQCQESTYDIGKEAFRVISELNGQTIEQAINSRGWSLYDNMYQNGNIDNPIEYVIYIDSLYEDWINGNLTLNEERLSNFFRILVYDSMFDSLESGATKCIDKTKEILETHTYFPDGIELWYYSNEEKTQRITVEKYDPSEVCRMIEEKLNENDEIEK